MLVPVDSVDESVVVTLLSVVVDSDDGVLSLEPVSLVTGCSLDSSLEPCSCVEDMGSTVVVLGPGAVELGTSSVGQGFSVLLGPSAIPKSLKCSLHQFHQELPSWLPSPECEISGNTSAPGSELGSFEGLAPEPRAKESIFITVWLSMIV